MKTKKIVSLLLAVAMLISVVSMMGITVSAATENPWADGDTPADNEIFYKANAQITSCSISGYNSSSSSYDSATKKGILVFNNTITELPNNAFASSSNLTDIILPNTVTGIGDKAFYNCSNLQSVAIPEASSIGASAFESCTSLQSVTMPKVTSTGKRVFYGCSNLQSVTLPEATSIGGVAFYNCSNLQSVAIPKASSIGDLLFYGCDSLTRVYAPKISGLQTQLSIYGLYFITISESKNGSISIEGVNADSEYGVYYKRNEDITVTITTDAGYTLDTLKYSYDSTNETITKNDDGEYSFTMPSAYDGVTVTATFTLEQASDPVCYIDADSNGTFDGEDVKYATLTDALAAAKPADEDEDNPTVIRMIANSAENIEIVSGRFITIDLNGYVLENTGNSDTVIFNYGTLTVTDSNRTTTHYYTVAENSVWNWDDSNTENAKDFDLLTARPNTNDVIAVKGGAITGGTNSGVSTCGAFILENGNIIGNRTPNAGGGVFIGISSMSIGSMTMNNGIICGNCLTRTTKCYGGGIYIYSGTTFTMNNGTVSYNRSNCSGGGIGNTGEFIFYNGTISRNSTAEYGGGIYTGHSDTSGSCLTMYGGNITENIADGAEGYGGGISTNQYCIVKLLGGNITGNKAATAGGIESGWDSRNPYTIGGNVNITGNTALDGTTLCNLYIYSGYTVSLDNPTDEMMVGITTATAPTEGNSVQFTSNGTAKDLAYFSDDYDECTVKYNTNGYLELVSESEISANVSGAGYSASLTLSKNIDINFKMKNISVDDASKLVIYVGGELWDDYKIADSTLSGVLSKVEPKNIGKDLRIVIIYENIQVKNFDYSVKSYCDAVFNANTNGKYADIANICTALLNYGKYAEDYANGNTASTVNEGHEITFGDSYDFTEPTAASIVLGNYAGANTGATLQLSSTIKLVFSLDDCEVDLEKDDEESQNFFILNGTLQINPNRVDIQKDGNTTTVSVDLYAYQLATQYTLKLKGVNTSEFRITYGVYNYCYNMQSSSDATLKALCQAIHAYSEAVQAYIA